MTVSENSATAAVGPKSRKKAPGRGSKPGERRGGRKKGTPNKITAELKAAILLAGERADPDGMVGYLTRQANKSPASFLALLGKVLPLTVSNDPDSPFQPPQFIIQPVLPKGE